MGGCCAREKSRLLGLTILFNYDFLSGLLFLAPVWLPFSFFFVSLVYLLFFFTTRTITASPSWTKWREQCCEFYDQGKELEARRVGIHLSPRRIPYTTREGSPLEKVGHKMVGFVYTTNKIPDKIVAAAAAREVPCENEPFQ